MGLLDRIDQQRRGTLAFPVGQAVVEPWDEAHGHDQDQFSPESYGDYLLTSNEVFNAVTLRARLVSSVPLRLYRGRGSEKVERDESAPAKLLRYVNPFWSAERLARMDELSMGVFGQTAWAIEKDDFGQPKEIWWLKASRLRPVPHKKDYLAGFLYESNVNGEVLSFRPDEIVWQRYPNPLDEFSPLSPIAAARLAADTAAAMMKSNRAMHENGLQIAGVLSPKGDRVHFTKEQAKQLEEDLYRRFAGADKAHKWAVLRYEAQFSPATVSPKDAEFINGLGVTARMVYNAYGVPSPLLNDMEHATLANVSSLQTVLWEHALVPDLGLRAGDIREQFLPLFRGTRLPDHAEYDFGGVAALQTAKSAAWDRDRQAIDVGAMTINEYRAQRGMPPVPWGNVWWAPVNRSAVTDESSAPQGDTSPTELPSGDRKAASRGLAVTPAVLPHRSTEAAWADVLAALTMDGGA